MKSLQQSPSRTSPTSISLNSDDSCHIVVGDDDDQLESITDDDDDDTIYETNGTNYWNNFLVNLLTKSVQWKTTANKNANLKKFDPNFSLMVLEQSGDDYSEQNDDNWSVQEDKFFTVHRLSSSNVEYRKSWGNFVNVFDEQGKQKNFICLKQLSNYLLLDNYSDCNSPLMFYATLFTGNYPKPLYNGSGTSWRMRFNMFVSGIEVDDVNDGASRDPDHEDNDEDNVENVLHLGELHLYFHVERGHQQPLYQNLCFFYDKTLLKLATMGETIKRQLEQCAQQLKNELSYSKFIEQLYFPIDKCRFKAVDNSVDYFDLRQQDLQAAIQIANEKLPFQFLHLPKLDDGQQNRRA